LEKGLSVTGARLNGVAAIREIEMVCVLYEHKSVVDAAAIQREEGFREELMSNGPGYARFLPSAGLPVTW
jgi:hypothetical protein